MKNVEDMTEADVVAALGPPDKVTWRTGMTAIEWKCFRCLERIVSAQPVRVPAPCPRCGGIGFMKVR